VSVTLSRNDDYWDKTKIPRLNKMVLFPMPEATTRLAALRSGQVDWIEVPPPDAVPSLKSSGFEIVTGSYPHVWPWVLNLAKEDAPWKDVRVRRAINYCLNRDGLVTLLNGLAEPAVGAFKPTDPQFGKPKEYYVYDPAKGKESWRGVDERQAMINTIGHLKVIDANPGYELTPRNVGPQHPYWVVSAAPTVINGHNGIFQEPFLKFVAEIVFTHVSRSLREGSASV
jgi:hypothetical protein